MITLSVPKLSIILMVDQQRQRSANALRCLLEQTMIRELEILLIDFSKAAPLPGSDHPSVRLFCEDHLQPLGQLRADYLAKANATVVAFFEDHVSVGNRWAEAVLKAHDAQVAGVGGEVHNGNEGQGISHISWLFSFGLWLPPVQGGDTSLLPGNNSSYKRDVLLAYGEVLPTLLEVDMLLQHRLCEDGYRLVLDPSIKFSHCNELTVLSLCKGYYGFNRCLGAARVRLGSWKLGKSLLYLALTPLIPLVRTFKTLRFFAEHRPQNLGTIMRHMHWLLLVNSCAVIGQLIGIMAGSSMGAASIHFLDYELNEPRGTCETINP